MQHTTTDLLLIADEGSAERVDAVCRQLPDCTLNRLPLSAINSDRALARQAACALVFTDAVPRQQTELLSAFARALNPAPVVVFAPGIAAFSSPLIAAGIDDCVDTDDANVQVMARIARRTLERARQRMQAASAEHQYRDLFDHMPIAAFCVDSDGAIADANRAFLTFLSAPDRASVTDAQLNGLLAGLCKLQQVAGGNAPVYRDTHIIETLNGSSKHVVVYARQHRDQPLMDVYLTDITEQETQTRRVVAAENRLRHLYDNVPVMMFTIDQSHRLRDVNRTLAEKAGLRANVMERFPIANLLHPDYDRSRLDDALRQIFSGSRVRDLPVDLIKGDGSRVECLFSASPLRDTLGEVAGAHAMLVDVSDRNNAQRERDRLQEQLQLTQKLESIGELAAGIAHEINTPAQYVSDNLTFLLEAFGDMRQVIDRLPELITAAAALSGGESVVAPLQTAIDDADLEYLIDEIPTALEQGKHGIQKIREIVLALKDFSHPGSGDAEPADINRIIDSTVTVARNEWKYVAELDFDLAEGLPMVECYPSAIAQVVLNMVVNAAHAISDSRDDGDDSLGHIAIRTRQLDEQNVEISISDDGPGIPDEIQRKIFDPFFTTKEVGRGTGQGLAISRRVITDQHKGTITLHSEPGCGTTFRIVLPLRRSKQNGLSEEAA